MLHCRDKSKAELCSHSHIRVVEDNVRAYVPKTEAEPEWGHSNRIVILRTNVNPPGFLPRME